jgi:hypothetical protein
VRKYLSFINRIFKKILVNSSLSARVKNMKSEESLELSNELTARFPTQEAAKQANDILQEAGLSSSQTMQETSIVDADPNAGQMQTQGRAEKGAITGGVLGALFGLLACFIRIQTAGSPFLPGNPSLSVFAVAMGASIVGSICFSLIGVITTEKKSPKPLLSNPKVPSHEFLVTVNGNHSELEQAIEIIQKNGGRA